MEDDHQKNGNERKPAGQLKLSNALWPLAISGYAIYQALLESEWVILHF